MSTVSLTELVLPTPTEFLRWITQAELYYQKQQEDTTVDVTSRVSKAQSLVAKQGVLITTYLKVTG